MTGHYLRRGAADETGRKDGALSTNQTDAHSPSCRQTGALRRCRRRPACRTLDPHHAGSEYNTLKSSKLQMLCCALFCWKRSRRRDFLYINNHNSDAALSWTLEQIMAIEPIFERRQSEERPLRVPVHQHERDPCFYCWNSRRAFCQKGQVKVALLWPKLVILSPVKGRFKPVSPWEHIWLPVVIQLGCSPSPSYLVNIETA